MPIEASPETTGVGPPGVFAETTGVGPPGVLAETTGVGPPGVFAETTCAGVWMLYNGRKQAINVSNSRADKIRYRFFFFKI